MGEKIHRRDRKLRLSDAFETVNDGYEWTAHMLNINAGYNQGLLDRCPVLKGYVTLMQYIREYQEQGEKLSEAVDMGIDRCIKEDLLKEYLLKKKSEVKLMLLTEFDEELFVKTMKEEGREEGREEGEDRMGRLNLCLIKDQKMAELERAAQDKGFRESLYKRYGL